MSRRLPEPYRATIYSRRTDGTSSVEQVQSALHHRIRAASRTQYIRLVMSELAANPPDIIQIENRPFTASLLRRRFPRLPLILSLHSTTFVNPRIYGRRQLQVCFDKVDYIAVNSEYLAGWLRGRFNIPLGKLYVCRPGVDVDAFASKFSRAGREQGEALREELGYEQKKLILYMGRLVPIKGVHHLLDVLPNLVAECDDAVLVICGSAKVGSDRLTPYVRRLHRLGNMMPRHVRFIPYVPHSSAPAWYQAADVVAVPSASEEAFGLVNAEALACGTPVVATRAGGIVEIVRHELNGLLVDPMQMKSELASSLRRLLGDKQLRERLGRQGADMVTQHFTWHHTAASYAALYEQCAVANVRQRHMHIRP
jgi:spore coat protein SA